jgi:hypothetical protein
MLSVEMDHAIAPESIVYTGRTEAGNERALHLFQPEERHGVQKGKVFHHCFMP